MEVNLTGAEQLLKRLQALGDENLQRKMARRALRKGAIIFRDAARENARRLDDPQTRESIARNIAIRESRRGGAAAGGVMLRVGVLGGAKKTQGTGHPGGDTFYWRFLEFGTKKMAAQPFLRPVLAQKAQQATDAVAADLERALDKLTV